MYLLPPRPGSLTRGGAGRSRCSLVVPVIAIPPLARLASAAQRRRASAQAAPSCEPLLTTGWPGLPLLASASGFRRGNCRPAAATPPSQATGGQRRCGSSVGRPGSCNHNCRLLQSTRDVGERPTRNASRVAWLCRRRSYSRVADDAAQDGRCEAAPCSLVEEEEQTREVALSAHQGACRCPRGMDVDPSGDWNHAALERGGRGFRLGGWVGLCCRFGGAPHLRSDQEAPRPR